LDREGHDTLCHKAVDKVKQALSAPSRDPRRQGAALLPAGR
jgi:hypothetical protein